MGKWLTFPGSGWPAITIAFTDGEVNTVLHLDELSHLLNGRNGIYFPEHPSFDLGELRGMNLNGQCVLALASRVQVDRKYISSIPVTSMRKRDTIVTFLVPTEKTITIVSSFYIENESLMDFAVVAGDDNTTRFIGTLMQDYRSQHGLIVWARAEQTSTGQVFILENSVGWIRDDMVNVTIADPGHGFASDDSGGLFAFSMRDHSFFLIDRDSSSPIKALLTF